jgi:hypothetical protein
MGTPVKNLQDEKLGKVENLLVDLPAGRIVAIIVSSGGFLGIGDELSAVPPTALRFTADRDTLQLDASKETLSGTRRISRPINGLTSVNPAMSAEFIKPTRSLTSPPTSHRRGQHGAQCSRPR